MLLPLGGGLAAVLSPTAGDGDGAGALGGLSGEAAPAAQAAWFRAEPIDGPAEIESLGDVDVARDGSGGVVYVKRDAGVPHWPPEP